MDENFDAWLNETFRLRGFTDNKGPNRLYKFLSSESKYFPLAMHELLLHGRLYLSSRRDFNDPFDTQFGLDVPDNAEALAAVIDGMAARAPMRRPSPEHLARIVGDSAAFGENAKRGLTAALDSIGIFSMTDSVAHPLMWAHYACSHRGIALAFRLGVDDQSIGAAFPVRYQETYPRTGLKATGLDVYHALTKGLHWAYEQEWRIVEAKRARQWKSIAPASLKAIIFGARSTHETYEFVLDLISRRAQEKLPPLEVIRAVAGEAFHLSFERLRGEDEWRPVELT